jgi:hypothetical protein
MKAEDANKAQEDAAREEKAEGSQCFTEMCRQMMAGGTPACCGTQMRDMMSHWMTRFQAKEGK